MIALEVHKHLPKGVRADVRSLAADVEERDGAPPLSDQALLQLDQRRPALLHIVATAGSDLAGYAQVDGSAAEVLDGHQASAVLLAEAEARASTGLLVWSHGERSPVGPAAEARGYVRVRVMWQLRRPLADLPSARPLPEGVQIRPFEPGRDEDAWLAVNAAAFADHPEQGKWTRRDIEAREREPWFDPAGFLLAETRSRELLGYHWTKVHPDGLGEVYVLGVSPTAQGMRLGASLLLAGLAHLAGSGIASVLLYVEESNSAAMHLYETFGFSRHDRDVQYRAG